MAYRTQGLQHAPVELGIGEAPSPKTMFRLWLRATIVSNTIFGLFFTIWMLALSFSSSTYDILESNFHTGILSTGIFVSLALFWVILLVPMVEEPIAEWKTLLDAKAPAAASSYAAIFGSLRRRQIPVNTVAMRVRSQQVLPEAVNNRLVITEQGYVVNVSVFPYGTSLHLGWVMSRNRRGATLIGIFAKELFGALIGRTGLVNPMLRAEKARAMREAVHSAVREGVEVAIAGVEVPIAATFGQEIPIQDVSGGTPSAQGPVPMATGVAPNQGMPQSGPTTQQWNPMPPQ